MKEAPSPLSGSRLVGTLFAAGLTAMPFDAVRGIDALGELGNELSFPLFALAIAAAVFASVKQGISLFSRSLVIWIAAAALAVIAFSFFANAGEILTATFRERSALNKYLTSLLVVLYGFALAWLAERIEPDRFVPLVTRFVSLSALIAIAYLPFELAGERGLLGGLYGHIDSLVHSRQADIINAWDGSINQKVLYDWDARLRSVSFEPPAFGNYTGFAWPWVWYAAVSARPSKALRSWLLCAVFTLVILITASRTGMLMLAVNLATLGLLTTIYVPRRPFTESAGAARLLVPIAIAIVAVGAGAYLALSYQSLVDDIVTGDSVSNISRFGFQVAGFRMFFAHPLFGAGFGQFGIQVFRFLPDWIYGSPEVVPMVTFPQAPWPSVYSLYARLGAELGAVGLVGWIGLWLGLAVSLARVARLRRSILPGAPAAQSHQPFFSVHFPVILNCIGVLTSGIATDTFRTPMFWVTLGLSCGILTRAQPVKPARRALLAQAPAPRPREPRLQQ